MFNFQQIVICAIVVSISAVIVDSEKLPAPSLTPIIITPANYNYVYNKTLNTSLEYVFLYSEINVVSLEGARITVTSNASSNDPLIVVVRQKKGILSWQLPLPVENKFSEVVYYALTSRTLCSSKYYKSDSYSNETENFVTISISTASSSNISFGLNVVPVQNFYIETGTSRNVQISPSEPVYFGYDFKDFNDYSSSVLISVESDSDVCMTLSIQNTSCPVFDLERNIQFAGYWQTVSQKGGITVPKTAYPNGFFVVLVVKADDSDCLGNPMNLLTPERRSKNVTLTIKPSIANHDYIIASLSALSLITAFCSAYIIGTLCYKVHHNRLLRLQFIQDEIARTEQYNDPLSPQPSGFQETGTSDPLDVVSIDSSLDEDDIDMMEDANADKDVIRTKLVLSVCDLARKQPKILRKKSRLYMYYLITIAIFYAAPVVQLVVTYQNVLHVTGNQDLCYYNFLCSHPLFFLSDFNHVFSNSGYILLGLLFMFIVYMREKNEGSGELDRGLGIPQHYGLFYAMGFALMMEGVMSGSYHMCPNHSNFQFDTSFMYIIAVLCIVKIYQNRHPDINARAPVTFAVLATTMLLALLGVLEGIPPFWIFFSVVHLTVCLSLSAQIYYMGRWKFDGGVFRRMLMTWKQDARSGVIYLFRPVYWRRLLLLIIGNLCNVGLAVYGNMHHDRDFATYLLIVLMSNLILYTFFYIIMKLIHKEKILLQPLVYIILSFVTWGGALYFFINKTISWALTPAQSRIHNRPCVLLNFYDFHDIWHFLSALAMFFSFMVLLTLDDDLADVHRTVIAVF